MKIKIFFYLFILIVLIFLTGCVPKQKQETKGGEEKMNTLSNKRVLMVIAPHDFRDEELLQPKEILENAGMQVSIGSKGVSEAQGSLEAKVKVDLDLSQVKVEDYEAIVFVGGPGSSVYFNEPVALDLAKEAADKNKVIGAICIAPSILANAGVLEGKKATAFSSEKSNLEAKGVVVLSESVVQDDNIITASGPQAARAFGEKIVEALSK